MINFKSYTAAILLLLSLTLSAQSPNVTKYVAVSDNNILFENAILYDGLGNAPKTAQHVLVEDGVITRVSSQTIEDLPPSTKTIDMTGKTLIPGLVMLHEHMFYPTLSDDFYNVAQMSYTFPKLYLAGGATTIRTAGSVEPQTDINLKNWIDDGRIVGPNIFVTGPFINRDTGAPIPVMDFIESPEDAGTLVDNWAGKGATSFKVYQHITQDDLSEVIKRAHNYGHSVTGHLCSVTYREAADLGIDNLEHGFMASSDLVKDKPKDRCKSLESRRARLAADKDDAEMEALMKHLIAKGVTITSTLPVFEPYTGKEVIPGGGLDAIVPALRQKIIQGWINQQNKDGDAMELFKKEMYWEKKFYDMGGKLVVGTDPTFAGRTVPGYANQRTLELLVDAGFTIETAIKISTSDGAKFLGISDERGTIEVGKKADLVVIDGDLSNAISNIRKMEYVFRDGIGYDSKKLFESVKGEVGLH